jgi:hypothetical protein
MEEGHVEKLLSANFTAAPGLVSALAISRIYLITAFVLLAVHLFIRFLAAPSAPADRDPVNQHAPEDAEYGQVH